MEDLAPPLCLLLVVRNKMECGESVRTAIELYTRSSNEEFRHEVRKWLVAYEAGQTTDHIIESQKSPYRKGLLRLLEKGLSGFPIFQQLQDLETEIIDASSIEMQRNIAVLPIKMLLPLLFFQFPSYMVLLLMPFVRGFL